MEIERRERPPWRPARGERIGLPGTTLSIPEWAGFVIVLAVCIALLVIFLTAF